MLEKNDQMLNIVPVAPEDKLEKNIEFGFEHELFEAEKIEQNNSFDNINSALIKTYGKKVFKLNPYKDLNPVSIENVNIQLNDSIFAIYDTNNGLHFFNKELDYHEIYNFNL